MIKAIFFDADGMVIQEERFSKRLARDFGITTQTTAKFFEGEFQQCLVGKADLKEELKKYARGWGWEKSIDEFLEYWFEGEDKVDERLLTIIKRLRQEGIKCYLATNQEKYRTQYLINQMGFAKVFDRVFSSAYIGYKKPESEFFEHIMEALPNLKRKEVLYWDDRKERIEIVRQLGFNAEWYRDFDEFKKKISELFPRSGFPHKGSAAKAE